MAEAKQERQPSSATAAAMRIGLVGSGLVTLVPVVAPEAAPWLPVEAYEYVPIALLSGVAAVGKFARNLSHEFKQPTEEHPKGRKIPWYLRAAGLG